MSDSRILLGHGSGGRLMHDLIRDVLLRYFPCQTENGLADAAPVTAGGDPSLVFTTDGFVVKPRFFPGGDIGRLAVCGTVNDLAVMGARPLALSCALIIEEGLPLAELETVLKSMAAAAREAGVEIITGDTKVVEHGAADGLFITTAGIGRLLPGAPAGLASVQPGDRVFINGPLGQHGAAVMAAREGIAGLGDLASDAAPLQDLVAMLLSGGVKLRVLRDPTRGGLASTLNEFSEQQTWGIRCDEDAFPKDPAVSAYCDALGLDPLYVANEGKLTGIVEAADAPLALELLRSHPLGRSAALVGETTVEHPGEVLLRTSLGGLRRLSLLAGEQLPRIC